MTSQPQAGSHNTRRSKQTGVTPSSSSKTLTPNYVESNHEGKLIATENPNSLTPEEQAALLNLEGLAYEEKKKEWASWANDQFTKCKNARSPFERQWYLNLAFVNGRHYVAPLDVAGEGFRLTVPKSPAWRVKLIINKVRTAVRTECAKLSQSRPIPTVVPASGESDDFSASRVAEQLLKSAFNTSTFRQTYRSWIWWGSVCGVSFLKSYWSPNEDDPDTMQAAQPELDEMGQPVIDPQTNKPMMQPQKPAKGRIIVERVSPFHVYVPDLLTETIDNQPYLFHVTTRTPLWVKNNFGIDVEPDSKAANTIIDSAFLVSKGSEDHMDSVLVKELWLKKNAHPDFPEGGMLTIINDQVVQCMKEWPWPFEEYPFYKYDGLYTGGFYSDSMVVDLIPLNKEYNRTRSQMVEIKNTMGKPKFVYQKGSLNPRQITSEPGQGIPYIPGFQPPNIIPAAEIPATMPAELERLNQDMDDISGQHEIARAGTPPQVTSGTAIAFLQEQDDTKLSYQVSSIEGAVETLGKHYLKYVSTYWDSKRIIRITGKDESFEAIQWQGSDLKGNTDVKIQTGSALPTSKAARQAMLTEFMQNGWVEPSMGMEVLDLSALDRVIDELLIDKRQAQRENFKIAKLDVQAIQQAAVEKGQQLMAQGVPPVDPETGQPVPPPILIPVNSFDNHEAHIAFHNMFRKTQDYELLDPLIKQQFELHIQMHQLAITAPQQGELGPSPNINDPEAPVKDPESGELMPGPFNTPPEQPELPLDGPNPLEIAAQQEDLAHQAKLHQLQLIEQEMKLRAADVKMKSDEKLTDAKAKAIAAKDRSDAKKEG